MTTPFEGFAPAAMAFLRGLKRNNRREWFETHRAAYEQTLRTPFRALVEELDVRFARLAPEFVGDPKRSMFRIHRDVRFSKDKSPYKTHAACWIHHRDAGRGVGTTAHGGAGFYFHLEPGASLVAGGIWMPPRESLALIREALVRDQRGFERIVQAKAFRARFESLTDDPDERTTLKRLPRGFAVDHPAAPWLRFVSFTASRTLTDAEALSPRVVDMVMKDYAALLPLSRWLNAALGFAAATRR